MLSLDLIHRNLNMLSLDFIVKFFVILNNNQVKKI